MSILIAVQGGKNWRDGWDSLPTWDGGADVHLGSEKPQWRMVLEGEVLEVLERAGVSFSLPYPYVEWKGKRVRGGKAFSRMTKRGTDEALAASAALAALSRVTIKPVDIYLSAARKYIREASACSKTSCMRPGGYYEYTLKSHEESSLLLWLAPQGSKKLVARCWVLSDGRGGYWVEKTWYGGMVSERARGLAETWLAEKGILSPHPGQVHPHFEGYVDSLRRRVEAREKVGGGGEWRHVDPWLARTVRTRPLSEEEVERIVGSYPRRGREEVLGLHHIRRRYPRGWRGPRGWWSWGTDVGGSEWVRVVPLPCYSQGRGARVALSRPRRTGEETLPPRFQHLLKKEGWE